MKKLPVSFFGKRPFLVLLACLLLLNWLSACAQSSLARGKSPQPGPPLQSQMELEFQKAERLLLRGETDQALQVFINFRQDFFNSPYDSKVLQRIAQIHFSRRDYPEAIGYLELIMRKYPDFSGIQGVRLTLAYSYFYLHDLEKAVELVGEIKVDLLKPEENKEFVYLQAQVALKERDYPVALAKLSSLLTDPPGTVGEEKLKREIQEIVFKLLNLEQLKNLAPKYRTDFPGALLRWQLANSLRDRGEKEEARKILTELIFSFPDSEWVPKARDMLSELLSEAARSTVSSSKKIPSGKPPIMGAILPLSGEKSELGLSALNGIELAYTGGVWATTGEIQLIIKDDKSSPQKSFEAFRELAQNERVLAIIGPAYEESAQELASLAENFRLPTFSPDSQSLKLNQATPYFFRNSLTYIAEAKSLAHFSYQTLGIRSLAIVFPNEPRGIELKNYFSQGFQEWGGQIAISYPYSPDTVDFSKIIADLTAGGINFQALFVPDSYQVGVMIASQLAFSDLTGIQLIGTSLWDSPAFLQYGGASVEGAVFSSEFYPNSILPQINRFVTAYQNQFGRLLNAMATRSYDIANILLGVMRDGARTREEVKEKILQIRNYPGVSRLTAISATGDVIQNLTILRVEGGQVIQLQ